MTAPKVTVVLSTYNGSQYLPEQLASLNEQARRPDSLVLRDDGSTDDSVCIVREWSAVTGVQLQEVAGERLGPARSFLTAALNAAPADVYMFCDQDDIWLPDKISRAVDRLPFGPGAPPSLLATRLAVVAADLTPISLSNVPKRLTFSSAVCESMLTGCTIAFNAAFRDLLGGRVPENVVMHDWWCYLLATGAAQLVFDCKPTLLYRQHGSNALGHRPDGLSLMFARVARFVGPHSSVRSRQLAEFADLYMTQLKPGPAQILQTLLRAPSSFAGRLAAAAAPIERQTLALTLTTRVALLMNRF